MLLGSDFPNIPYAYEHQLDALERLELGDDWLRAVLLGERRARCSGSEESRVAVGVVNYAGPALA